MKLNNRRLCVGPRGGRRELPTSCDDCATVECCRRIGALPASDVGRFFGCSSWIDGEGYRIAPEADVAPAVEGSQEEYCRGCACLCNVILERGADGLFHCEDRIEVEDGGDVSGPGEPAMDAFGGAVDPGPAPDDPFKLDRYVDPPAPFRPAELEGGQGVLPMPDAGPLFSEKRGRS